MALADPDFYDKSILDFKTYEDYLDSNVEDDDLMYLEDPDNARLIVELGYKGRWLAYTPCELCGGSWGRATLRVRAGAKPRFVLTPTATTPRRLPGSCKDYMDKDEFWAAKKVAEEGPTRRKRSLDTPCSTGKDLSRYPLLQAALAQQQGGCLALQQREELVRNGKLSTIVFIRHVDANGMEVSGYIDFGHRLKLEDFADYFDRKKKFLPKPSDLSYYNWKTQTLHYNNSSTFQVIADNGMGLLFKHKRDRKTINVEPRGTNLRDSNSNRYQVKDEGYTQVVLYDHYTRRRN
eukprot:gene8431-1507_t